MKLMAEVYNEWYDAGGSQWDSFVASVEKANLPYTDLGDGILVFAGEGVWKVPMYSQTRTPWSPGLSDEEPKPVTYRTAGRPMRVEHHKVLERLSPSGLLLFNGRHFAEVPHGTVCDYEESGDGFIVWLEDEDGPTPVSFNVEGMRVYLARHNRERPEDLVGDAMWSDAVDDRVAPHPLYMEVDPTGTRIAQ